MGKEARMEAIKGGREEGKRAVEAELDSDEEDAGDGRRELVNLSDIEMVYKKKKHDKEARMEAIKGGREEGKRFGGRKQKLDPHASTNNKQKSKKKNFSMMKHKIKAKGKKSFREKQMSLKKQL